jgi:pyruvate/2-oxoglutarate dehydrogenase complex dihydrolipoamide dehydrogenase (E3) component
MSEQVDVVVVGLGPGGEEVAGDLAEAGLTVVGVEKELLGGECPYWGCVPTKMMVRAADLLAEARRIPGMAGDCSVTPDWSPVARRIRVEATDTWDDRAAVERFEGKGGRFVRGAGRLVGPRSVAVGETIFEARRAVVIATGATPMIPPLPGLDQVPYWTNRNAVAAEALPASLIVLGGGATGLEMAQVFTRFGVRVSVVESQERLLGFEEPEAGKELTAVFAEEGIAVHTGAHASSVSREGEQIAVELGDGRRLVADRLLLATGRKPNVAGLGLKAAGLDGSAGAIEVDANLRAGDGIWAVGDVTGKGAFTHVAIYQARIAVADILGKPHPGADYRALPRVTFTDPEVGSVGLSEQAATERGLRVRSGSAKVSTSARGWIHGPGNTGFIKLVEDSDRGVLLGATSMGPWGGEVLSMLTVAVHAEVTTEQLRHMIYAYPTFHRGVEDALHALDGAPVVSASSGRQRPPG